MIGWICTGVCKRDIWNCKSKDSSGDTGMLWTLDFSYHKKMLWKKMEETHKRT